MNKTVNYNLNLPTGNDIIDVRVLAENFEIIDRALASMKFFLQANYTTVTVGHDMDVSKASARIVDAAPSTISDRACLDSFISFSVQILINGEKFMTVDVKDYPARIFGFYEVSETSGEFTGRMCPIWLVINALEKTYTVVGDIAETPYSTHSDGSTIYLYLGSMEFDWEPNKRVVYENWSFESTSNTQVTIDFSNQEEG